jgi:hypothetical protein
MRSDRQSPTGRGRLDSGSTVRTGQHRRCFHSASFHGGICWHASSGRKPSSQRALVRAGWACSLGSAMSVSDREADENSLFTGIMLTITY